MYSELILIKQTFKGTVMNAAVTLKIGTLDFNNNFDESLGIIFDKVDHDNDISIISFECDEPEECSLLQLLINRSLVFDYEWTGYKLANSLLPAGGFYNRVNAQGQWKTFYVDCIEQMNMVSIDEITKTLRTLAADQVSHYIESLESRKVPSWEEQALILNGEMKPQFNIQKHCFSIDNHQGGEQISGYVEVGTGVALHFNGYGDLTSTDDSGTPLYCDLINGELHAVIFGDINLEEPTHIINLEAAKLSNRIS